MRLVVLTKGFRKDFKKLQESPNFKLEEFEKVLNLLQKDEKLPTKYRDHKLKGLFKDYRECHIQNDILLVYKKEKMELVLVLARMGSHSELFG